MIYRVTPRISEVSYRPTFILLTCVSDGRAHFIFSEEKKARDLTCRLISWPA
jgi:hypothetical protein